MRKIDITGRKYEKLTALKSDPERGNKYWLFECTCGNIVSFQKQGVVRGKTKSCGCLSKKNRINKLIPEMKGKKFNKLTVLEFSHTKKGRTYWKCLCDCGKEVILSSNVLRMEKTKSCGCFILTKKKPGESGLVRLFLIYKKVSKRRCLEFELTMEEFKNITSKNCNYCGCQPDTISVNGSKKSEVLEYTAYIYNGIDRIDSTKGYVKGNVVPCCRWCNTIKRERTVEDFKNHINRIYSHISREN